jgi:hypothetical protein
LESSVIAVVPKKEQVVEIDELLSNGPQVLPSMSKSPLITKDADLGKETGLKSEERVVAQGVSQGVAQVTEGISLRSKKPRLNVIFAQKENETSAKRKTSLPTITIPLNPEVLKKEIFDSSDSDLTPTSELKFFDASEEQIISPIFVRSENQNAKRAKPDAPRPLFNPFQKRFGFEVMEPDLLQDLDALRTAMPKKELPPKPIVKSKRRTKIGRPNGSPHRNVYLIN